MRVRFFLLPVLAISTSALAVAPATEAVEVAVQLHPEVNAWTLPSDAMPVPSWDKDGTLSIWYQATADGSSKVIETGARVRQNQTELSLCYSRAPMHYESNQPVPAIVYPVAIEFRIKRLEHRNYTVKSITICE
jgi:hypothetical protein